MQYSEVLIKILQRAGEVQKAAQIPYLSAPAILVAVAELCGKKYHGITNYFSEHHPVWYEEERLRYLYGKMFRASGNLVSTFVMKRLSKDYSEYDVDFLKSYKTQLEMLMAERDLHVLTADIVFLLALDTIKNRTRMGLLPQYQDELCVKELLIEVDGCIYDYVISEIEKIQEQLQKKWMKPRQSVIGNLLRNLQNQKNCYNAFGQQCK